MKKADKRQERYRGRTSLTAIGLLAIGAGVSLAHLPEAQAYQLAISSSDQAALEQFLRDHPTSSYAPDVIGRLSFGTHRSETTLPEPVQLASNAGGNGGGHGNGNGHGGGNGKGGGNGNAKGGGQSGGNGNGNGGGQGGGNGNAKGGGQSGSNGNGNGGGAESDSAGSGDGDSPNNGHANGGNGHFHSEDDQGRPDMFGGPGKPDIGPPGLSGY
jgi:hypothetical protein